MTATKTYRWQMRAYRRLARWADCHSLMLNVLSATEVAAFILYVFIFR